MIKKPMKGSGMKTQLIKRLPCYLLLLLGGKISGKAVISFWRSFIAIAKIVRRSSFDGCLTAKFVKA